MRKIQAIVEDIQSFQFSRSAGIDLTNLAEELEAQTEGEKAIRHVLELFERYPHEDFGMPGPLAHFLEGLYGVGYEEELELSLRRCPTALTVWLANRIANAKDSNSERFVNLLADVANRSDIDEDVRSEAQQFFALHTN